MVVKLSLENRLTGLRMKTVIVLSLWDLGLSHSFYNCKVALFKHKNKNFLKKCQLAGDSRSLL